VVSEILFKYKALNDEGKIIKKTIEGETKETVSRKIRNKNLFLLDIKEKQSLVNVNISDKLKNVASFEIVSSVKTQDLVFLSQQFHFLLKSGLTLLDSIDVMIRQLDNKTIQNSLDKIKINLQEGNTFYQSLSNFPKVYPLYFREMIKMGEQTGTLETTFANLKDFYKYKDETKKTIRGAMYYPMFIVGVTIVAFLFISNFVIPRFNKLFTSMDVELPTITQWILSLSQFVNSNLKGLALGSVILIGTIYFFFQTKIGKRLSGFFLLHAPLINKIYKKINMFQISIIISDTLSAGSGLIDSLELIESINSNYYYKNQIKTTKIKLKEGQSFYNSLSENKKHFLNLFLEMVSVGEEIGKLDETLKDLSEYYLLEIKQETKKLTSMIEPIMILLMGFVVGFMVIATVLPTFTITQGIV
jgi:type IV pilus assembly protein PilC